MQNHLVRPNQALPVLNDQSLPAFRLITITTDIDLEEMRVGYHPGLTVIGKQLSVTLWHLFS